MKSLFLFSFVFSVAAIGDPIQKKFNESHEAFLSAKKLIGNEAKEILRGDWECTEYISSHVFLGDRLFQKRESISQRHFRTTDKLARDSKKGLLYAVSLDGELMGISTMGDGVHETISMRVIDFVRLLNDGRIIFEKLAHNNKGTPSIIEGLSVYSYEVCEANR